MFQRVSRWVAFAATILALVAFGGEAGSEIASAEQPAAISASRGDASLFAGPPSDPEPAPVATPVVEVAPAPVVLPVVAPPPPAPPTCGPTQFCYPRVGIVGTIVPYSDCSGNTDVGTAIRILTCIGKPYLAAHAYTQFGRISGWRAGDLVFAYGARYIVVDAFTQAGCVPPARALAPLSMQTSLTPTTCGPILVVQARPE